MWGESLDSRCISFLVRPARWYFQGSYLLIILYGKAHHSLPICWSQSTTQSTTGIPLHLCSCEVCSPQSCTASTCYVTFKMNLKKIHCIKTEHGCTIDVFWTTQVAQQSWILVGIWEINGNQWFLRIPNFEAFMSRGLNECSPHPHP